MFDFTIDHFIPASRRSLARHFVLSEFGGSGSEGTHRARSEAANAQSATTRVELCPFVGDRKTLLTPGGLIATSLRDQKLQFLDRQDMRGVAMHHAVAISTEGAKVGCRDDRALTALGKRFEVVNLYVRASMLATVKGVEIKSAGSADGAVNPDRGCTILRATLKIAADT